MVLRENYFGSFTHFSTLNEYLDKRRRGLPVGDPIMQKYRPNRVSSKIVRPEQLTLIARQSNVFHLELGVSLTNALVVAPAGLPGYETSDDSRADDNIGPCVMMTFPELQVHLRLHDYYMGNEHALLNPTLESTDQDNQRCHSILILYPVVSEETARRKWTRCVWTRRQRKLS